MERSEIKVMQNQIVVKDWFANKIANEVKRNISMCDVFAIIRETEKAYYAYVNLGCNYGRAMWVPKSCTEVKADATLKTICCDFETAVEEFGRMWSDYT